MKAHTNIVNKLMEAGLKLSTLESTDSIPEPSQMSNTAILCFVMGFQGGTVHQVAADLGVKTDDILNADADRMGELCRRAQAYYWRHHNGDLNKLLLKHLGVLIMHLDADYRDHDTPVWLERAKGVFKIIAEQYPEFNNPLPLGHAS